MGRGLDVFLLPSLACVQFSSLAGRRGDAFTLLGARFASAAPADFGGYSEGDTPLPIPNRAVKPASVDDTRDASPRESRPAPTPCFLCLNPKPRPMGRGFVMAKSGDYWFGDPAK